MYQEINALNLKKDDFIAFASHELKTPLSIVKGYMQLGNSSGINVQEIYPKVSKQLDRLELLIDDLLDLSRIQAGKQTYNYQKVSLGSIIRDSIESLDPGNHDIVTDIPDDDVEITIDAQKIIQVLVNLITNAVKYSAPGSPIKIHAELLGPLAHISVSDEGQGIPAAELKNIFNQFYRTYNSTSIKGMGLGLFISKEIVEAHLGKIWAESEVGKGSTFHVTIPIERPKNL